MPNTVVEKRGVLLTLIQTILTGIGAAAVLIFFGLVFLGESIRFNKAQEIERRVESYKAANPDPVKAREAERKAFQNAVESVFWGIRRNEPLLGFTYYAAQKYAPDSGTGVEALRQLERLGLVERVPGPSDLLWRVTPLGLSMRPTDQGGATFAQEWQATRYFTDYEARRLFEWDPKAPWSPPPGYTVPREAAPPPFTYTPPPFGSLADYPPIPVQTYE